MKLVLQPELLSVEEMYGWYMTTVRDLSSDYEPCFDIDIRGWDRRSKAKAQTAVALGVTHQRGFGHGDIRYLNIMVNKNDPQDIRTGLVQLEKSLTRSA